MPTVYYTLPNGVKGSIEVEDRPFNQTIDPVTGMPVVTYLTTPEITAKEAADAADAQAKTAKSQEEQADKAAKDLVVYIKDTVAAIPVAVIKRYPGIVGDVGKYLDEGNLVGAAQLLALFVADMQAANDTEALEAAAPVIQLLGG